ncbi:MAG: Crp/Fnr family transcriptional regulator [Capnocytophaga sp.]|nr:Crp/Fnr family transcriptional regulator [Capnocytophaga sp.]
MPHQKLLQNIARHVRLSENEITVFRRFWKETTIQKGDYLLRNGDVCKYDSYVSSGLFKAYCINADNGDEEILFFAADDWWASDLDSFSKRKPSIYNIQALQTSTVLQINVTDFEELLQQLPVLERYFRIILENYLATLQKRIIHRHIFDAERRYYDFLEHYPHIASAVPQYLIASYLGVSAEFLSRIRRKNKTS